MSLFEKNVKIKNVHYRCYWNWNVHNETCPIGRCDLLDSSEGLSDAVVGVCSHAFHYNCIQTWLKTNKNCPLCNEKWIFQKKSDNEKNSENVESSSNEEIIEEASDINLNLLNNIMNTIQNESDIFNNDGMNIINSNLNNVDVNIVSMSDNNSDIDTDDEMPELVD